MCSELIIAEGLPAYRKVQSEVRKAVRNAKKKFERKLAKDAKKNSMKGKTSNRVSVGPLVRDKVVITDDLEMCEVLNRQYCSVFTREDTSNLPEVQDTFHLGREDELQDIIFPRRRLRPS